MNANTIHIGSFIGGSMSLNPEDITLRSTNILTVMPTGVDESDIHKEYSENYRKYLAYARILTPSVMGAEDLVQQAFLNVVKHVRNNNVIVADALSGYLMKSIRNISISNHRKSSKQSNIHSVEDSSISPESLHLLSIEKQTVANALIELSATQRTVMVMTYFDGFKISEIAQELSISVSAVKTHLQRARKNMSKAIEANRLEETRKESL